jgi:hypothetical protein
MGSISAWSCICGDLSTQYLDIKSADKARVCEITLPRAYRIHLSDNWYCNIAGVAAINLSCITAYGQRIFIQSVPSELTFANADETISHFCEGEGCSSNPVVDPVEERIEKELITIGDKSVLRVLTKQDGTFILRYFTSNSDRLYVWKFESKDLPGIKASTSLLEEALKSMEFVP